MGVGGGCAQKTPTAQSSFCQPIPLDQDASIQATDPTQVKRWLEETISTRQQVLDAVRHYHAAVIRPELYNMITQVEHAMVALDHRLLRQSGQLNWMVSENRTTQRQQAAFVVIRTDGMGQHNATRVTRGSPLHGEVAVAAGDAHPSLPATAWLLPRQQHGGQSLPELPHHGPVYSASRRGKMEQYHNDLLQGLGPAKSFYGASWRHPRNTSAPRCSDCCAWPSYQGYSVITALPAKA